MKTRAVALLLAALFLMMGIMKLSGAMVEEFEVWGYGGWFSYVAGVIEIFGAVGLARTGLRKYGAGLLAATMITASGTHILQGEMLGFAVTGLLFATLMSIVYTSRGQQEE